MLYVSPGQVTSAVSSLAFLTVSARRSVRAIAPLAFPPRSRSQHRVLLMHG
jgi:hypothetical protein